MALTGKVKSANVVGTPKAGDALKLRVVYDAMATEKEAPWTVAVAAFDGGTFIGFDNTTHYVNSVTNFSVEFTCSIRMPSTAKDLVLELWAHPNALQKIEDFL